jgi:hypothetical protein
MTTLFVPVECEKCSPTVDNLKRQCWMYAMELISMQQEIVELTKEVESLKGASLRKCRGCDTFRDKSEVDCKNCGVPLKPQS